MPASKVLLDPEEELSGTGSTGIIQINRRSLEVNLPFLELPFHQSKDGLLPAGSG